MNREAFVCFAAVVAAIGCCVLPAAMAQPKAAVTLYVAPTGRDDAPGTKSRPFATLARARDAVRTRNARGSGPVTVLVRGGTYFCASRSCLARRTPAQRKRPSPTRPIRGKRRFSVGARASPAGRQAASYGRRLCPASRTGAHPYFRELWVNGARRYRARTPNKGYFQIAERPGADPKATAQNRDEDRFVFAPGDLKAAWTNPTDITVVAFHFWVDTHLPVAAIDEASRLVTFTKSTRLRLTDDHAQTGARYIVDNVYEALDEPGEWYLNRKTGVLSYLPRPGEDMTRAEVIAPRLREIVRFDGNPESGAFVEHVTLRGLTFSHNEWSAPPDEKRVPQQQAANFVPGAIRATGARFCALESCRVVHFGSYGVEFGNGCVQNRVARCEIADGAAGGITVSGGAAQSPPALRTGQNVFEDNHIHDLGKIHRAGVGVLLRHTHANTVAHNHIHHLFYSGVSVGWVWQYRPSVSRDNVVAFNHIHDIGQGILSDMGGVYTLGISPGTVIRNNRIHDVAAHGYGGWGIYTDQASTGILIENNVVYRTKMESFHQHWGKDNIIRNNIFAFGGDGALRLSKDEGSRPQFTLTNNILLTRNQPLFSGGYAYDVTQAALPFVSDRNLLWDMNDAALSAIARNSMRGTRKGTPTPLALAAWRALGQDANSVVADPGFADPAKGDFSLRPGSPALKIGFRPIDLSTVGVRPHRKTQEPSLTTMKLIRTSSPAWRSIRGAAGPSGTARR